MPISRRTFLASMAAAPALATVSAKAAAATGKKYKACIIGDTKQGGYGHDLHMVFSLRDDVEIVGLADPDEAGRTRFGKQCEAQRLYADYKEMLDKEKPELVVVAPRLNVNHKQYLLDCFERGAHGLVEKPLCVDLAEADAIISAADAKNVKWAIGFNFRASAHLQHARKLVVEDGIIGSILELRGRGKEDNRAGGEDLVVLGCHIFDLMKAFMDMPTWCSADITWNGQTATKENVMEATEPLGPVVGNRINAMFGFARGVPGYFSSMKSKEGDGGRWGLVIGGTKGAMTIRMDQEPDIAITHDPIWAVGGKDTKWEPVPDAPALPPGDPRLVRYKPIVDDLIASIEENRKPAVSIRDGRDSLEMVQAVFESHIHGGNRVQLPLKERTHPLKRWS